MKTYEVSLRDKDVVEGPWQQANLDGGASLIIPVPKPLCGAIVVGEQSIVYLNGALTDARAAAVCNGRALTRRDVRAHAAKARR